MVDGVPAARTVISHDEMDHRPVPRAHDRVSPYRGRPSERDTRKPEHQHNDRRTQSAGCDDGSSPSHVAQILNIGASRCSVIRGPVQQVGSAVFACPPGATVAGLVGEGLFS